MLTLLQHPLHYNCCATIYTPRAPSRNRCAGFLKMEISQGLSFTVGPFRFQRQGGWRLFSVAVCDHAVNTNRCVPKIDDAVAFLRQNIIAAAPSFGFCPLLV